MYSSKIYIYISHLALEDLDLEILYHKSGIWSAERLNESLLGSHTQTEDAFVLHFGKCRIKLL